MSGSRAKPNRVRKSEKLPVGVRKRRLTRARCAHGHFPLCEVALPFPSGGCCPVRWHRPLRPLGERAGTGIVVVWNGGPRARHVRLPASAIPAPVPFHRSALVGRVGAAFPRRHPDVPRRQASPYHIALPYPANPHAAGLRRPSDRDAVAVCIDPVYGVGGPLALERQARGDGRSFRQKQDESKRQGETTYDRRQCRGRPIPVCLPCRNSSLNPTNEPNGSRPLPSVSANFALPNSAMNSTLPAASRLLEQWSPRRFSDIAISRSGSRVPVGSPPNRSVHMNRHSIPSPVPWMRSSFRFARGLARLAPHCVRRSMVELQVRQYRSVFNCARDNRETFGARLADSVPPVGITQPIFRGFRSRSRPEEPHSVCGRPLQILSSAANEVSRRLAACGQLAVLCP